MGVMTPKMAPVDHPHLRCPRISDWRAVDWWAKAALPYRWKNCTIVLTHRIARTIVAVATN